MTHENSLKGSPFVDYTYTLREPSLAAHILHMDAVFLSASQQPPTMAYAGQLVHSPVSKLAYQSSPEPTHRRRAGAIPHLSAQWIQSPPPELPPGDSALGWLEAWPAKGLLPPWDWKQEEMRHKVLPKWKSCIYSALYTVTGRGLFHVTPRAQGKWGRDGESGWEENKERDRVEWGAVMAPQSLQERLRGGAKETGGLRGIVTQHFLYSCKIMNYFTKNKRKGWWKV